MQCLIPSHEVQEQVKPLYRDRDQYSCYCIREGWGGELRFEIFTEKFTRKGPEGTSEVILFLDLGDCYMDVYIYKISSK